MREDSQDETNRRNQLLSSFLQTSCMLEWVLSLYHHECREDLLKHWGITVNSSGQLHGHEEAIQAFQSFLQSLARTEEISCETENSKKI